MHCAAVTAAMPWTGRVKVSNATARNRKILGSIFGNCTPAALSAIPSLGSAARRISCDAAITFPKHRIGNPMPATHSAHVPASSNHAGERQAMSHYRRLLLMTVLSFIAMYFLMYAMVDSFDSYYNNINQVYMAGLMAAAMVVIELAVMGAMYSNRKLNAMLVILSIATLVACWALIRVQGGVGDGQFLRSMIPHHSGAILMCGQAPIRDPELKDLCTKIIAGQAEEIAQMKAMLARTQ
jgi:cation transport ATPase